MTVAELVDEFVARASSNDAVTRWTDRILTPVLAQSPEITDDAALVEAARAAVRGHWLSFLAALGEPEREFHLVQAGVTVAEELARRGHPLTLLFRVYRNAQHAVWEYATATAPAMPRPAADEPDFLVFFWSRVSAWLDASIEASVEVFQAERDRIRQGAAAQTFLTVRALLEGEAKEPPDVSAALGGYPIGMYNTAFVLNTDDVDHITTLRRSAMQLARALHVRNPLVVNPGGRDVWCWVATGAPPDLDGLRQQEQELHDHGFRVSVGTPSPGVEGFRLSHVQAQRAQRVSFGTLNPRALTLYADVELLFLVRASDVDARHFTRRVLGELAADNEGARRLRQTLRAVLDTGSVEEAATVLSIHRNTVRYRIGQAEEVLGRRLDRNMAEVEVALRYHEAFVDGPDLP